jgi:nucleoside-diphosphate-sugar epimerase
MTTALIGHTGFVGGQLLSQTRFDECFRSTDIERMRGRDFDLVVCSGVRAEKWKANADPVADWAAIERLWSVLRETRIRELVLISTVDVFRRPVLVDEDTPVATSGLAPYGLHRFRLEELARERFATRVVRLPGLFGTGLKKNIIYDLIHDNATDKVHSDSVFQFYDLSRLWADMETVRDADLSVAHLATPPVSVADVAQQAFGRRFENRPEGMAPARYDFRTKYADLFGGPAGYVYDTQEHARRLRAFVTSELNAVNEGRSARRAAA